MGRTCFRAFFAVRSAARPVFLTLLLAVTAPAAAFSQIVINEIYPDPAGADGPLERVEIYNAGTNAVEVTGWCIQDAATINGGFPPRCRLPEDFDTATGCSGNAIIQPGEFRLVKYGPGTTTGWLNQGGDDIYLCSNRTIPATIVHQVTYPTASGHVDEVWAALPNGSSNFAWRVKSLCASNGAAGDIIAPATVSDLVALPGAFPGEVRLTWTAPGDDAASGTASLYEIRVANAPITSGTFAAATNIERWINTPLPAAGGTPETLYVFGMHPDTTYYFALRAQDEVPNTGGVSNSPGTAPLGGPRLNTNLGYNAYFGNLHSHTGFSDGVQTPNDAYDFARNTAQTPLDFLAVTEHNHPSAGGSLSTYHTGLGQGAAKNDDGNFVAIFGQEWGLAANGHVAIYESPALFGWDAGQYDVFVSQTDYASLYTAILANPPASYPPIAMLCHPGASDYGNLLVTNDGKSVVHLMCLVNGPAFSTSTTESDIGNTGFDGAFQEALRKGYRVSPTADQDNHNATWGAATESRTAVLANTKTKSAILGGMASRRTYATQDHNVIVDFSADGHAMGEAFTTPQGIRIAAEVSDPDAGASVAQIDLFRGITGSTTATLVAWSAGNNHFEWRERGTFPNGTEAHYYLRIRMANNANVWTGPVYVTYDPTIPVAVGDAPATGSRISLAVSPNPARGRMSAEFVLPQAEPNVSLVVFDVSGRRVRNLAAGERSAGVHRAVWDGRSQDGREQTGLFFLRLETSHGAATTRVLMLR